MESSLAWRCFPKRERRPCGSVIAAHKRSAGFHEARSVSKASFTDLVQELIDEGHRIDAVPVFKGWMEVDSFEEYQKAWAKIRQ